MYMSELPEVQEAQHLQRTCMCRLLMDHGVYFVSHFEIHSGLLLQSAVGYTDYRNAVDATNEAGKVSAADVCSMLYRCCCDPT